ncbi:MAG: beta-ketoacyl-[acyl-carrier-protein] synthase family protein [Oligoflexia bacterium]|nr:beta-ketoacyl-[acyl-carrier-protein] synthase family protein [Oligoflexia bacterium]MBF0366879.1 beta-ketoacyl-[acyl-carrier-protein] synthase family protein [Oligoflexia bacterium]
MFQLNRIVITGVGLTAPNGNNLSEFRHSLLTGKSGIVWKEVDHLGNVPAGVCNFDEYRYQSKKARRRGTRAGAVAIYCAHEAIVDSKLDFSSVNKSRIGIYVGITEHGNVETESEVSQLFRNNCDLSLWSHHHNPRTVANSPAGEVSLNLGITGPHYTLGAACAAGNVGLIHAVQMLRLREVDVAIAGGISESVQTFGIFAAFKAQGALAPEYSRPLDRRRNGIVISEGGCLYTLERLEDALARGAKIYGEIVGYAINSDATDFVLPFAARQVECMAAAIQRAGLLESDIDIVSLHATGTDSGDVIECEAVGQVFAGAIASGKSPAINGMKDLIGHTMGASGALELAGNLPSFEDGLVHPFTMIADLDERCAIPGIVIKNPLKRDVQYILNNSFGMLGINSAVIVKKY